MVIPLQPGLRGRYHAGKVGFDRAVLFNAEILYEHIQHTGRNERRESATTFPVRSEYTLTRSGLELVDIIRGIKMWALKWKIDNIPCGKQDCSVCVL